MLFRLRLWLIILASTTSVTSSTVFAEEIPGLSYRKITTPEWQSVHVLEIDPQYFDITAAHAKDSARGVETVPSIAKRHKAIAAINGGFFKMGGQMDGLPAGILKIKGRWYGIAYRLRGAIGWSNPVNDVFIDRVQTKTSLKIVDQEYPVYAINQPGIHNRAVLYTDTFGKYPASYPESCNIVIKNNQVVDINFGEKAEIPKGGFIYSIGPNAKGPQTKTIIQAGDKVKIEIEVIPQKNKKADWQKVDNIIGGIPLLIENGRTIYNHVLERISSRFIKDRHARTAVGILENKHWVFVIVEKSELTGSPGMTISEITQFMQKLNCQYALNLDGGSSSTLYIDRTLMNHPELDPDITGRNTLFREISDAILILPKVSNTQKNHHS